MVNWLFSKRYHIRCPDGSTKMVYKAVDDAFPLYIPGWQAKASTEIKAWEEIKASLATDYANKIQGLIFRLDELNQSLMMDFRAAYVAYMADPCKYGDTFLRWVERIIEDQRHLRELKIKVQGLISLAQIYPKNPKPFFSAFVEIVHRIGGSSEIAAAAIEIADNRALAREWAERDHEG